MYPKMLVFRVLGFCLVKEVVVSCIYLFIKGSRVVILEKQTSCEQHKKDHPTRPKVSKGTIIAFVINNLHIGYQSALGKLISG